MKRLISWWVKNAIAANLLMVAIFLMGIYGFFKLEREFVPAPKVSTINVSGAWLGASPRAGAILKSTICIWRYTAKKVRTVKSYSASR